MEWCKWERGVFVFAFSSDRLMLCFIASRTRPQLDLQTWETVNIYTWAHKSIRPTSMRKEKKTKNCLTFSLAEKTRYKQMMQSLSPLFASWEPAPTICFQFALPQKCQVNFFPVWWNCWNAGIVRNMLAVAVSSHLVLFYSPLPSVCVSFFSRLTKATVLCRTRWLWHKQLPSSWWRENISCRTGAGLIRWNVASLGNFIADN